MLKFFLSVLLVVPAGLAGYSQPVFPALSYEQKPRIEAFAMHERIHIDGHLKEGVWSQCKPVSGFTVSYPVQGAKPIYDTRVMVMYDSVNLYIGAVCGFSGERKSLQVQSMKRDFGYSDNELFGVYIEAFQNGSLPTAGFFVSPFGTQTDIMFYNSVAYDYNWDAVWTAAASIGDSTWTAEIAIPFSSLRYPQDSINWSINFGRNIRNLGSYTGWSPWPMAFDISRIEYGGLLTGIHPPVSDLNMRLQPYGLLKTLPRGDGSGTRDLKAAAGGELKWAINTNTVLDATVNTDFAQADVDRQVVNLTRSSVYFPEKRQFFKENANLFSIGQDGMLQPFFSRSIGLGAGGIPSTIDGGLRLVQQTDGHSAGMLLMRQEGDSVHPSSWFNVLRYKRNFGSRFQLGAMTVMRYDEGVGKESPAWNTVGCVDGFIRIGQQLYIRQLLSASSAGDLRVKGLASVTAMQYSSTRVLATLTEVVAGKGYGTGAGFMERQDFIHTQPAGQLFFPVSRLKGFYSPLATADIYHRASTGQLQEITSTISPLGVITSKQAEYRVNFLYAYEHTDDVFSPISSISVAPGHYRFMRYELYARTNQAAHYSFEARVSTGKYYDMRLNSFFAAFRVVPLPHIAFGLGVTENHFYDIGGGESDKRSQDSWLVAPELRLAWNANWQLSGFYQYNTDANNGSLNMRMSWQYRPLSYVYLVYNGTHRIQGIESRAMTSDAILKISYLRQL